MILDEHGKVIISTHKEMSVDQPATEIRQETNKITQEESEETNESVKEKFQQFSPDNLLTLDGYLKDNEQQQQNSDEKTKPEPEKMNESTSQATKLDDCSTNNYARQPSEFHEYCTSLKASTCEFTNEISTSDVS